MCSFCHAPEHAYDVLVEDASVSREGLCPEAIERLLMAAKPQPQSQGTWQYIWNEDTHDWMIDRIRVACLLCDARLRKPIELITAWSFCAKCRKLAAERVCALRLHFDEEPVSDEDLAELGRRISRRPWKHYLRFNDAIIRTTTGLDPFSGPRAYARQAYPLEYLVGPMDPDRTPPLRSKAKRGESQEGSA